jgi:hypothetical protein
MIKPFLKIFTPDRVITALQANVSNAFEQFIKSKILDNNIISVTLSNATGKVIEHKLTRSIEGWIIIDQNREANIWVESKDTKTIALFANITGASTVDIKILIF